MTVFPARRSSSSASRDAFKSRSSSSTFFVSAGIA